ncbi:MAG TPA: glycine--tRNA ligase subunit beta [Thermoanaerobaculia bacterium]|jgi:glycyl-tRNA synthetase beta chain
MPEYLLEVRADEIPSRLLRGGMKQLATRLFEDLMGRGLGPQEVVTGLSQRRFVVCCRGLPEREPDREERELGPPKSEAYDGDGAPTEALAGFAQRLGVEPAGLEVVKTEKGEYVARVRQLAGRAAGEVLAEIVPRILREIRWGAPKLRRGTGAVDWIRPVRGLLSLLDGEVVPCELDGCPAGRATAGHPVLSPASFDVEGFDDYRARLAELGIETSFEARRERLEALLEEGAARLGGRLAEAPGLLDRLALRCEVPGVVGGTLDADCLGLPPEVVGTVLAQRQSAFALTDGREALPHFVTVMDRADDPQGMVKSGQEWAAAGHLGDARFHYESDRRAPLARRARRLDQVPFHAGLGHYADKSRRIEVLADLVAHELGWDDEADRQAAREAAALLKADLTTAMVRHFGTLRGQLGGLYARGEGYAQAVWQAIYDQYLPAGLQDPLPRGRAALLVAVADRLDDLVGFFGIGEAPTGSRDPHALRRRAQGLLRILLEAEMALDLDLVAARAVLLYNEPERKLERGAEEIVKDVQGFLTDRLRHLLGQRGYAFDEIEAALAVSAGTSNLPDLVRRMEALRQVREEPHFRSLVLSARRIFNIVKDSPEYELKPELLQEEAEKDLYAELMDVRRVVDEAADAGDYVTCLRRMEDLVPALDRFFADVLVMDEDAGRRQNRMALLQSIRRIFWRTARIREMVAERPEEGAG